MDLEKNFLFLCAFKTKYIHYGPSIMSQKEASRKPPGSPRRGIPGGFLSKLLKSPVFPANFKKEVR